VKEHLLRVHGGHQCEVVAGQQGGDGRLGARNQDGEDVDAEYCL